MRRRDRDDGMKSMIYRRIEEEPLLKWWESLILLGIMVGVALLLKWFSAPAN